jgi:hypothetical protein
LRTYKTEHTEVEVEMALPAQGADDSGRGASVDVATTTTPTSVVWLTQEVLDTIPLTDEATDRLISITTVQGAKGEDEDGWTHINDKSYEGAIIQGPTRSVISRYLYR